MRSRLRRAGRFIAGTNGTRRKLLAQRWAADIIATCWSALVVLLAAGELIPTAGALPKGVAALFNAPAGWNEGAAATVVRVLIFAFIWFWAWMALDAYSRRFADSDVLSFRRLVWLLALCAGWLTAPVYWFAVKRRSVLSQPYSTVEIRTGLQR